jgi:Flp pilus assembly protein TadB
MKRPSLRRRKQATPQEQAVARSAAPEQKKRRLPRRAKRSPTPQEQAAAVAPGRQRPRRGGALAAPLRKLTSLRGRARIVVWGLLAVIVVFVALQLRGGRDDPALVRTALARYQQASGAKDYQTLCDDLLASSYVKQTASSGLPCEVALRTALENVRNPTLRVLGVEVNGDRAAARVRGSAAGQVAGEAVYTLVREGDAWRILPPRPAASTP